MNAHHQNMRSHVMSVYHDDGALARFRPSSLFDHVAILVVLLTNLCDVWLRPGPPTRMDRLAKMALDLHDTLPNPNYKLPGHFANLRPPLPPLRHGYTRRIAIGYIWLTTAVTIKWDTLSHPVLRRARIRPTLFSDYENVTLVVLVSIMFGPDRIQSGRTQSIFTMCMDRNSVMNPNEGTDKLRCFFIPLLTLYILALPRGHDLVSIYDLIHKNLSSYMDTTVSKIREQGIWSIATVDQHIQNAGRQYTNQRAQHDLKGMNYSFLRILEMFYSRVRRAQPNGPHAEEVTERCTSALERSLRGADILPQVGLISQVTHSP